MGTYKKIIQWVLAVCCLAYIFWFFLKNTQELTLVFKLNPLTLAALTCFIVLGHIMYSYRFKIILEKCSGCSIPFWPWFRIVVLSRFLGTFVPQAGNIYRSVCLKKNYHISYTRYAGSFFSFAWMDTSLNLICAVGIVLAIKPDLQIANFKALNFLTLLTAAIVAIPILLEFIFRLIRFRNRYLSWLHAKLSEMLTVSVSSLSDGVYMLKIVLTGIIAFINTIAVFYICFISLDMPVNLPVLALFYVVLKLSTQIIITPGNLGVRELAYGILSEQMHIGMAQGIVISAIIRILGTCVIITLGTLFGGIDLLRHRRDYSKPEE